MAGEFNRAAFNRKSGGMVISESYDIFGSVTFTLAASVRYSVTASISESLQCEANLWWGYDDKWEITESMKAQANARLALFPIGDDLAESMEAVLNPMLFAVETIKDGIDASLNMHIHIYPVIETIFGAIDAAIDSEQMTDTVMTFENINLHPGSVLIIDSENYTITLDGVNIISEYEGNWFEFMPELRELGVTSNVSGQPQVSILYREHYL